MADQIESIAPEAWRDFDTPLEVRNTAAQLLPILYEEVRRLARRERRMLSGGETLQTTALVHEAYLKLRHAPAFSDGDHFLRAAALAMRHALINYARDQAAAKRGGGAIKVDLEEAEGLGVAADSDAVILVNEALQKLATLSPRLAQVVECRFFAGYGEVETAQALGTTDRTVRRDWVKARAWLRRELGRGVDAPGD